MLEKLQRAVATAVSVLLSGEQMIWLAVYGATVLAGLVLAWWFDRDGIVRDGFDVVCVAVWPLTLLFMGIWILTQAVDDWRDRVRAGSGGRHK